MPISNGPAMEASGSKRNTEIYPVNAHPWLSSDEKALVNSLNGKTISHMKTRPGVCVQLTWTISVLFANSSLMLKGRIRSSEHWDIKYLLLVTNPLTLIPYS